MQSMRNDIKRSEGAILTMKPVTLARLFKQLRNFIHLSQGYPQKQIQKVTMSVVMLSTLFVKIWLIKSGRSKVLVEAYGTSTKEYNRVWSQFIPQTIDRYSLRAYSVPNTATPDCKSRSLGKRGRSSSGYFTVSFCELKTNDLVWQHLSSLCYETGIALGIQESQELEASLSTSIRQNKVMISRYINNS